MNLDKFVSKTFAEYLEGYRELTWRERLVMVYFSDTATYASKIDALNQLLLELGENAEAVEVISDTKQFMEMNLSMKDKPTSHDEIFVARAGYCYSWKCEVCETNPLNVDFKDTDVDYFGDVKFHTGYFSSFSRAHTWLEKYRNKLFSDSGRQYYSRNNDDLLRIAHSFDISRFLLDSNSSLLHSFSLDFDLEITDILISKKEPLVEHENRHLRKGCIDMESPFKMGDVVRKNYARAGFPTQWKYAVVVRDPSESKFARRPPGLSGRFSDSLDMCVAVCMLQRYGRLDLGRWEQYKLEKVSISNLPSGSENLVKLSQHIKREVTLKDDELKHVVSGATEKYLESLKESWK